MSTLANIAEAIGGDAAEKLVQDFAGRRLYIPQTPGPDDAISRSIGLPAARKLAQIYGGDRMDVPNPAQRRNSIVALRATGLSVEAIARQLHCTTRRVYQVLAEARNQKGLGTGWCGAQRGSIGGDGAAARKVP
jgi:hypothetical protein